MQNEKSKNKGSTRRKGDYGEKLLKRYLLDRGYGCLAENLYIGRYTEIDLVFHGQKRPSSIVCIEVKTQYISPQKSGDVSNWAEYWTKRDRISRAKVRKLVQLANNPSWVLRAIHSSISQESSLIYKSFVGQKGESVDIADYVQFCIAFVYIEEISGNLHRVDFARLEDIIDY